MSVRVAIFEDDSTHGRGLKRFLQEVIKVEADLFDETSQFTSLLTSGEKIDADVALIDLSFFAPPVTSEVVIKQLLPKDARRVVISGHFFDGVKRNVIIRLEADNFWHSDFDKLGPIINLGRVTDEEIALRGFSVVNEGEARTDLGIGIAPDAGSYDDRHYIVRARRGEKD